MADNYSGNRTRTPTCTLSCPTVATGFEAAPLCVNL